jgi:phage protein D
MRKLHIRGKETARQESVAAVLERLQAYISDPSKLSKQVRQVRRLRGVVRYHQDMQAKYRDRERQEKEQREKDRGERERQEKEQREKDRGERERREIEASQLQDEADQWRDEAN